MKNRKFTISVGIPAYNEEANIVTLLESLRNDTSKNVKLIEIIIISDGSTDTTVHRARLLPDSRIKVYHRKRRLGIVYTENEILSHVHGDILIMLDADVVPINTDFFDKISEPIRQFKKVGCVGAATVPLRPIGVFERIIANSHYMKQYLCRKIRGGNNVYLCHGRARAFSKSFYSKLMWINDCPEDSYSFFACKKMGYKFIYTKNAGVYFRSPQSLRDHIKQSTRFVAGIKKVKEIFGDKLVENEYKIPRLLFLHTLFKYLMRNPFSTPIYFLISIYIRLVYKNKFTYRSLFSITNSSKRIKLYKGYKLSRI